MHPVPCTEAAFNIVATLLSWTSTLQDPMQPLSSHVCLHVLATQLCSTTFFIPYQSKHSHQQIANQVLAYSVSTNECSFANDNCMSYVQVCTIFVCCVCNQNATLLAQRQHPEARKCGAEPQCGDTIHRTVSAASSVSVQTLSFLHRFGPVSRFVHQPVEG